MEDFSWRTNPKGYEYTYMVRDGKKKVVLRHRYVMEQALGRRLSRREDVHHVDRDTSNNDLYNLEVRDHGEHSRMHLKLIPPGASLGCKHRKHRPKGAPKRPVGRPKKIKPPAVCPDIVMAPITIQEAPAIQETTIMIQEDAITIQEAPIAAAPKRPATPPTYQRKKIAVKAPKEVPFAEHPMPRYSVALPAH